MIGIHWNNNIQRDLNTTINKADVIVIYKNMHLRTVLRDHILSSDALLR